MSEIDRRVGKNLRHFRMLKGITQTDLGDRIGIGHTSISLWENGERSLSSKYIFRLCKVLECSADQLLNINTAPFHGQSKSIDWITRYPGSSMLDFTEDIHDGIKVFSAVASKGHTYSSIRYLDERNSAFSPLQIIYKLNAALQSKGIEFTNVERDFKREEALKKKYKLLHCIVARLDDLPADGVVDIPIRSEAVAFLAAKYCTPMLRGLSRVGFSGGYPLVRFLNLIPSYHPDVKGISWYSFLATQRQLSIGPMSASANGLITQLLHRQPHTKGFTMPFINLQRRSPEYYRSSSGVEKKELDYAFQIQRIASYVQAGFLVVGDPKTDYEMAETETVNPELTKLYHNLSSTDKDRCKGDLLLRLMDGSGNPIGTEEEQQANESLVFSIGLEDLKRMVNGQQNIWILCDTHRKTDMIHAALRAGYANSLVIENQIADSLLLA